MARRLLDTVGVLNGLGRVAVACSVEVSRELGEVSSSVSAILLNQYDNEERTVGLGYGLPLDIPSWENFTTGEFGIDAEYNNPVPPSAANAYDAYSPHSTDNHTHGTTTNSVLNGGQRSFHTIAGHGLLVGEMKALKVTRHSTLSKRVAGVRYITSGDTVVGPTTTGQGTRRPSVKTEESHIEQQQKLKKKARERVVPASRLGRMASFGGLAAGLGFGTAAEVAKRAMGISDSSQASAKNPLYNDANLERIVNTLCRVRGAALKLGQMISLQDGALIPEPVQKVFDRVRNNADFMPTWQMESVLEEDLGKGWRELVKEFDYLPLAAASIGQVHRAVLHDGAEVAMKIQYPGVAESIDSDVNNLSSVLKMWDMIPQGLFLDSAIAVARKELTWETDYQREAQCSMRFKELLADDDRFAVPSIIPELSTKRVLTAELIHGLPLDHCTHLPQQIKNEIAQNVMSLCLKELFQFRFMQTDPNWSNFFYNSQENKVYLLDFGASRDYSKQFVDDYLRVIHSAVVRDREGVIEASKALGYLTGYESKSLVKAHVDAVMILGEPFSQDREFDFSSQDTTVRIHRLVPMLLEGRLTPPPDESYSLHRKMAGSFLLCAKLQAKINCYDTFQTVYRSYKF